MDLGQAPQAPVTQSQHIRDSVSQPELIEVLSPSPAESTGGAVRDTRSQESSAPILNVASDDHPARPSDESPYTDFERMPFPRAARSRDSHVRVSSRRHLSTSNVELAVPPKNSSGIDWIVPVETKGDARRTIGERLQPTIDNAASERDKYARKAMFTGYALNIAIGLQVFLGALTTGLAAALTDGRKAQVSTAVLGGLSTLVASYLARARGSGEPELSTSRVKDLDQFLRECRAFQMDHAHEYSTPENGLGEQLDRLRRRFEALLGNTNAERKSSTAGITSSQTAQP